MSGGYFFCIIFFLLLVIATLTSTVSLLEVIVAALTEETRLTRTWACIVGTAVTAVIGVFATLSLRSRSSLLVGGTTIFDLLDHFTALYLMPIGGLLIVLFVGWRMKRADVLDELTNAGRLGKGIRKAVYQIIRWLAPVAILTIFISQLLK